jgi:bacillithiol system protein YtxJ
VNWSTLENENDLKQLNERSFEKPQIIFKHSTRCSISDMAKGRIDRAETSDLVDFYYLDLLRFRKLSDTIAEKYAVHHQSPQALIIQKGECIYESTHWEIDPKDLIENIGIC